MSQQRFAPDFSEMLRELSAAGVEFLVVGGHARAAYGEPRATKDLDIWVRPTDENARRVWAALAQYGAPLSNVAMSDFATPGITFQIGIAPYRIDILTDLTALSFEEAWANRVMSSFGGGTYPVIGKREFITNKRAAGRPQDLADADHVERAEIDTSRDLPQ
ncbi:MAG: nucleotidyltransferase family protein [Acidobacteriota bacterium]|nr:nucleotidyltransferase family protein [Acidobacteriota bacterium]